MVVSVSPLGQVWLLPAAAGLPPSVLSTAVGNFSLQLVALLLPEEIVGGGDRGGDRGKDDEMAEGRAEFESILPSSLNQHNFAAIPTSGWLEGFAQHFRQNFGQHFGQHSLWDFFHATLSD